MKNIIITIILVLLVGLSFGAYYYFTEPTTNDLLPVELTVEEINYLRDQGIEVPIYGSEDTRIKELEVLGTSTELTDIEKDLLETDLSEIDKELDLIDQDLLGL